jgi:hypothetical protein
MSNSCLAKLAGRTDKTTVNVHTGPGLSRSLVMQAPKGATGLPVLDVRPDEGKSSRFGKTYRWFKLQFADGREGWVRDDLVEIVGDCRAVGYRNLSQYVNAFSYTHNPSQQTKQPGQSDKVNRRTRNASRNPTHENAVRQRDICRATITGIPDLSFVRIRRGPGTNNTEVFQVDKGTPNALVTDVKPDQQGHKKDGKTHQWFHLTFHDGRTGWARDDLVSIQGECGRFGYDDLEGLHRGSSLVRHVPIEIDRDKPPEPPSSRTKINTSSACTGKVVSPVPAPVFAGPHNARYDVIVRLAPGTKVGIFDIRPQDGGGPHRWLQVEVNRKQGWIREDSLAFEGNCERFTLRTQSDKLFPPPMRRYQMTGTFQAGMHDGWDMIPAGAPVLSAPVAATVVRAHRCSKCTADKPAARHHGLPLHSQETFKDSAWGWGFGHHVIVRYAYDVLPADTRNWLSNNGKARWYIFALYGHLQRMSVHNNQTLTGETELGLVGDTGNSTGAHLHLEIRAGSNGSLSPWSTKTLLDPGILFRR